MVNIKSTVHFAKLQSEKEGVFNFPARRLNALSHHCIVQMYISNDHTIPQGD